MHLLAQKRMLSEPILELLRSDAATGYVRLVSCVSRCQVFECAGDGEEERLFGPADEILRLAAALGCLDRKQFCAHNRPHLGGDSGTP